MEQTKLINLVKRIQDFLHNGENPKNLQVEAILQYMESLKLKATNILKAVKNLLCLHNLGASGAV